MHSLWFVQWEFTRRDHPGNLGRVSGSGLVNTPQGRRAELKTLVQGVVSTLLANKSPITITGIDLIFTF